MQVFCDPAAGRKCFPRKTHFLQSVQALRNISFIIGDNGIAVRFLVAGVRQAIEGQRIILGGGQFLFNKAAEDADLGVIKNDIHSETSTVSYSGTTLKILSILEHFKNK